MAVLPTSLTPPLELLWWLPFSSSSTVRVVVSSPIVYLLSSASTCNSNLQSARIFRVESHQGSVGSRGIQKVVTKMTGKGDVVDALTAHCICVVNVHVLSLYVLTLHASQLS
jgi:hypothetical protein